MGWNFYSKISPKIVISQKIRRKTGFFAKFLIIFENSPKFLVICESEQNLPPTHTTNTPPTPPPIALNCGEGWVGIDPILRFEQMGWQINLPQIGGLEFLLSEISPKIVISQKIRRKTGFANRSKFSNGRNLRCPTTQTPSSSAAGVSAQLERSRLSSAVLGDQC